MRWSERPPVVRSYSLSLQAFRFGPRPLSVAVAHLILVRWYEARTQLSGLASSGVRFRDHSFFGCAAFLALALYPSLDAPSSERSAHFEVASFSRL